MTVDRRMTISTVESQMKIDEHSKTASIGWFTAALFVVADMAGGGVVAMPSAMLKSGDIAGSFVMAALAVSFCYTAHLLSDNWSIMCDRWDDYSYHCRKPYPEMAYRAMGSRGRTFCSSVLNVMLFSVSVVYLLISSSIINDFITSVTGYNIGFCFMILIIACVLYPVTLLKSPQDFWWAIVVAMLTTLIAVILIIYGTAMDYSYCAPVVSYPPFSFESLILSLGTFMFGFGGHVVFPSIQHDMRNPQHFTKSSIVAFLIVTAMYASITILTYLTYGSTLTDSVITSIQTEWIQSAANVFIAVHCILTLTIVINPLNQEVEHLFNADHHFGWHRVIIRTAVMLVVVFTAETVPNFGPILNIIGGTCVALTSAIMPSLYNLYLRAAVFNESDKKYRRPNFIEVLRRTPPLKLAINSFVIILAVICGVATTVQAIAAMTTTSFTVPCYIGAFMENQISENSSVSTHCCGQFHNVSRYGDPDLYCFNAV
ncbi:hypothetical protein AB6A40_007257 [Gnathostoma spinigerum]|uniref:Amino acid transporter transmembrane domain-containing protein n=1 Tax=Gnathostoma spinigerum TaxID=75299 RepID=A0ABD6EU26_9BILA